MSANAPANSVDGIGSLLSCVQRKGSSDEMDLTSTREVIPAAQVFQDQGIKIYRLKPGKFRGNVLIGKL